MNIFGFGNSGKDIYRASPIPVRLQRPEKVAILTDDKVEDLEFFYPYYRLTEAGYTVDVVTPKGKPVEGKHGLALQQTRSLADVTPGTYALLMLPGGKAPASLRHNADVINFVKTFAASGKPIAAICHGPQILVSADLVRGRSLSAWPEVGKEIQEAGGRFTDEALQVEGQFITSRWPGDLPRFMDGVLQALQGAHAASRAA